MYGSYEDGIRQTYFDVVAKGADPGRKEEFVSIIRKVLTDTVENGIDPKALEAGINYMEFRYREADFSSYPEGTDLRSGYSGQLALCGRTSIRAGSVDSCLRQIKRIKESGLF